MERQGHPLHTFLCIRGLGATTQTDLETTRGQQCWGRSRSKGTTGLQAPRVQNGNTNACSVWAKEVCEGAGVKHLWKHFIKLREWQILIKQPWPRAHTFCIPETVKAYVHGQSEKENSM